MKPDNRDFYVVLLHCQSNAKAFANDRRSSLVMLHVLSISRCSQFLKDDRQFGIHHLGEAGQSRFLPLHELRQLLALLQVLIGQWAVRLAMLSV